jgi:hypothetical protein
MNDMTTACATCPHRSRPQPLALLPEQRVDVPAGADLLAKARAGRVAALAAKAARRAAAFQPVETILIDPAFRARIQALNARRGGTLVSARPVIAARPLAAG